MKTRRDDALKRMRSEAESMTKHRIQQERLRKKGMAGYGKLGAEGDCSRASEKTYQRLAQACSSSRSSSSEVGCSVQYERLWERGAAQRPLIQNGGHRSDPISGHVTRACPLLQLAPAPNSAAPRSPSPPLHGSHLTHGRFHDSERAATHATLLANNCALHFCFFFVFSSSLRAPALLHRLQCTPVAVVLSFLLDIAPRSNLPPRRYKLHPPHAALLGAASTGRPPLIARRTHTQTHIPAAGFMGPGTVVILSIAARGAPCRLSRWSTV
ncbi:uncharacterized protein EI97DRAFT_117144 [Westerdykella ornata]|uniref:Uncharacterized protein n=1 Tax=Westerdykella ornata TaxID=318751 RepID=A0A6A6JVK8_WESOR|nr:uncharacterized protein EI97DRAFT_117144 [Westerdykella ornata]KAF2280265.1 hypothetical protein EI97DRAFT_117144 [Westerdykella ornata]